jgi:hypothetical protein
MSLKRRANSKLSRLTFVPTNCDRCGCDGDHGARTHACGGTFCCCDAVADDVMASLAQRITVAFEASDLDAIATLMAPDVCWGAPQQSVPTCTNRAEVLRWYEAARDLGAQAHVATVLIFGRTIVLGLKVTGLARAVQKKQPEMRWQALSVSDELIGEIRGYDTRDEAELFALSGTSQWKH